jgi:hypothetical protein
MRKPVVAPKDVVVYTKELHETMSTKLSYTVP